MQITVVGLGYVGLTNAVLLAQHNKVTAVDISRARVDGVNARKSHIKDPDLEQYLSGVKLDLTATSDARAAYLAADFIVIATPTDYDPEIDCFDTSSVEGVIAEVLAVNPQAVIVIRSTVPMGFTLEMQRRFNTPKIIFCPEFLSENRALHDTLYPARVVLGFSGDPAVEDAGRAFAALLVAAAIRKDAPVLYMRPTEAEVLKLFSNAYLALRVSFFNELDTYAEARGLDVKSIIQGVCLDPRIGGHYNNPSFGYGGKCLPKDTKQLRADYGDIPNDIIGAIVQSNNTRKDFIAERVAEIAMRVRSENPVVGIYRLTMKSGSDNFRQSSILDIIARLVDKGLAPVIYEPLLTEDTFQGLPVMNDLAAFKARCDIIVANRTSGELYDVPEKLYTRDIFSRD